MNEWMMSADKWLADAYAAEARGDYGAAKNAARRAQSCSVKGGGDADLYMAAGSVILRADSRRG